MQKPTDNKLIPQEYLQLRIHPVLILIFFCATAFFAKLSGKGLMSYDDTYYAEKAREILTSGQWFTIHYNGNMSFDTAPMYYWLAALSYMIFGITEYAAVLPSALLGTASVVLLFYWVRRESGPRIAFVTAIILATIPHFVKFSRHSMLDVTLTFFTIVSLFSFFEAQKKDGRKPWYLLWGFAAAGGVLTKSILGTFPIWIGLAYLVMGRRWRELFNVWLWLGMLQTMIFGVGWYLAQYWLYGDVVKQQHIGGLLVERAFQPEQAVDFWYRMKYVFLPIMYIPHWALFMYAGVGILAVQAWRGSDWARLMTMWVFVMTFVLTMCANTKTWYYMSAFPALAIAAGLVIDRLITRYSRDPGVTYRRLTFGMAVVAIGFNLIATTTPIPLGRQRETDVREFSPFIQKLGQAGYKMIAYKADRFSLNNASLFYAEYAFNPVYQQTKEFLDQITDSVPVAAMIRREYWKELQDSGELASKNLEIVKQGDDYMLVTNRKMDFSDIQMLKARWLQ